MRALVGEDILRAWECSRELPEQEAVIAILELALPELSRTELASLPLSERNALLLKLRAATLGRRMEGFAVCPDCGAKLEFTVDPLKLAKGLTASPAEEESGGHRMRAVNSLDLLASSAAVDEEQARSILLARTLGVEEAELGEPDESLLERFDRMNASAEIRLRLQCEACQSRSPFDFDIARFLLREISAAARRLMEDIHDLASAYGWSEQSIAAMSVTRRIAYLELLNA